MKATFPHMGNLYLTARPLLNGLGLEVVVPPPCTKKTLALGTQYAPESSCLPLKINLGNYLEAAESGAEIIVMAGGVGPCRSINPNIERRLGRMGVEVTRVLYLSEWINDHLFGGLMRVKGAAKKARRLAHPFLQHSVGGDGLESVGSAVYFAQQGFDALIHVAPLTCMPEIVAKSILPRLASKWGYQV